ncbi:TetR/AcrR family transcriptional regulator [Aquipuribacter nitratireducens]|uniref:TetR/AcrR family transcriptional regulator n=1 Tax=Aquipuribacter nitratireducens TaxID=650104 RepID=A0ABW0GIA0_9MICO
MPRSTPAARDVDPRVERTRARVLAATADLLLEDGFARLTIDEVATRSGVARSTIYRNWATRAPLLLDAVQTLLDPPARVATGDAREDLVATLLTLARALDPATPQGRLLPGLVEAAERDAELARLHRAATRERRELLADAVRRAVDADVLAADTDPDDTATRLAALLYYRRLVSGEPVDEGVVRGLVADLLPSAGRSVHDLEERAEPDRSTVEPA